MTINTGVNVSLLKPQTFHVITYLVGNRSLQAFPQRGVLIGPMSAAGTAVPGTVYDISDPGETDGLFGKGSYLSLMCRMAFAVSAQRGGPLLSAVPLAETTTKRVTTLTLTGPATESKDLITRIAGRYLRVGVNAGDTATTVAAAVAAKAGELSQNLPVTASPAAGVVTFTDVVKGVLGADVIEDVVQVPAGMTAAFAQTVAGVGVLDMQSALDAIAGLSVDGVAVCNHQTADITEINTQIATTWTASEKKPRWFFLGEPGSIGTATTLASNANHEGVIVVNCEQSRSLPCEIATAAMVDALSKSRPNANYDGDTLPLYPPPQSFIFTSAEVETALNAGLTPLTALLDANKRVIEGVVKIVRLVTTRTTSGGVAFTLLRDFGISRTTWYMAAQYDARYRAQFGPDANPDGVLETEDTEAAIRDMVIDLNYAAQEINILRNVDVDKDSILVEEDIQSVGRLNVESAYHIVNSVHQVAFVHRAYQ